MIFRQLFEPVSSTYTYLLGCEETGQAVLIDPAMPEWQRDLAIVNALGLKLAYTVETHVHADHITSALYLKRESGCQTVYPETSRVGCADMTLSEGAPFQVGGIRLEPIYTPGHTDDHFAYRLVDRIFTGDALLIDGCGRTDFQNGDAATLYRSIQEKLFLLPGETLVYPAHDYSHRHVSSISQERERNPRLGGGKTLDEFVKIMGSLDLPYPKFIDHAVPGNRDCGVCPSDLDAHLRQYCEKMEDSPQG
jgi:glyoxylase-like metal-dependent hydrolase (beta-lactamase superfamily II)